MVERPNRILVPVDLSPLSRVGVGYGGMLAAGLGSAMTLVTNVGMAEREEIELVGAEHQLDLAAAADLMLRRMADEHAPGIDVATSMTTREFPADGILDAASVSGADLIVMTSHGRTGVRRLVLGSVAEKVARTSPHPVTIVPVHDG